MTPVAAKPAKSRTASKRLPTALPGHADKPKQKNEPAQAAPQLRFRMRVANSEAIAIGPGKIELLQSVQQHQSISAAAKALGMSYRRAWLLIDEMNRTLKQPVVATETGGANGGGTVVTEFGQRLISLYQSIEARAYEACRADIRQLLAMVARD